MLFRSPEIDILARKVVEGYNLYGQSFLSAALPAYIYRDLLQNNGLQTANISVDYSDRMASEHSPYDDASRSGREALRAGGSGGEDPDGGLERSPVGEALLKTIATEASGLGAMENGSANNIPDIAEG